MLNQSEEYWCCYELIDGSFVPPLVYATMGSSKDLAVGPVAIASLLMSAMLGKEVSPTENPKLYLQLALTATLFAGAFQAALGLLRSAVCLLPCMKIKFTRIEISRNDQKSFCRIGFLLEFLSHATIVGFMGGAATIVCLQQLKGVLGLVKFTQATDLISVVHSVFSQIDHVTCSYI